MQAKLANAVGYQCVWLSCVAGAGSARGWVGPLVAAIFATLVLAFGGKARSDLRLMALAVPLGFGFDSALAASGWLHYAVPWPSLMAAPAWIFAIWVGFALTLNHSLAFLRYRPWLAALLGLAGGPLAYLSAEHAFHAVTIAASGLAPILALSAGWAILLPLLFRLDREMNPSPASGAVA